MASNKLQFERQMKNHYFEIFNTIVNNFSGKDFTTDDLMLEFFGLKNFTPKDAPKQKDPNAPKRAQSAYFHFSAEKRPEVMENLKKKSTEGKIDVTLVSKELGQMWKKLSDKKKKPYEDKASADKQRYEKEKAEYDKSKADASS
tara:strand:+ start:742 stop:1173 length:432 start_codon:yes stop_codon:yes gene_type:complete